MRKLDAVIEQTAAAPAASDHARDVAFYEGVARHVAAKTAAQKPRPSS